MNIPQNGNTDLVLAVSRSRPAARLLPGRPPVAMLDPALTLAQRGNDEDDTFSFGQLAVAFRRNRWLALGILVATMSAAAVYTHFAVRVYQSSATIRIDDQENASSVLTGIAALPGLSKGKIQTEIEVLHSRQLSENVATALRLNFEVRGTSAARRLVHVVNIPADMPESEFILSRSAGHSYTIRQQDENGRVALPAVVEMGTPFSVGRATLILEQPAAGPPAEKVVISFHEFRHVVDGLLKNLAVSRPNKEAQIVKVQFESKDPLVAAAVPNLLLDEFMRYKAQTTRTEASSTVTFLRQQVASYDAQLKGAESALGTFREQAQVVSIGDEAAAQVKRMADMQAERDQLHAERQALASILSRPSGMVGGTARDIAAFPTFITNRGVQDILQSLTQLENQRAELLVRRNPGNAEVVAVAGRISDLERQLTQTARAYVTGLDSKLTSLDTEFRSLGRQVETIPAREIAFARLSRQQKLLEDISTLLETRLKEAEIKEAVQPGDVRVIDRALVPDRPTSPNAMINMLAGIVAGLFIGFAAAMAREMLDNKVRTKDDVQSATGGIPILAAIPRIRATTPPKLKKGITAERSKALIRVASADAMITQANSRDASAEAYRALRTNITFASVDHSNQALVVTSALPGDGKSLTTANLAITLVQQGVRTLLVDADLRKGTVHRMFGIRREPGLSQILVGEESIASAVVRVPVGDNGQHLHVLTSGRFPPNPAELLGSEKMRTLLEDLRQQYDMILFDTPPLSLVTDAAVLGTIADSTMLVARAGITDKRALHHAAAQLYHLRVHVSGTIVNDLDSATSGYGYDYGYGYAPGYEYGKAHA